MTKAVKQVPQRDTFIVAGDFNTSFSPTQSLEGPRTAQLADPRPDEANLTNLVSRLRLVARNTWHCRQCFTYEQGEARNQIDFIFTREPCGGSGAKQASPLVNFYLGSWNSFLFERRSRHRLRQTRNCMQVTGSATIALPPVIPHVMHSPSLLQLR